MDWEPIYKALKAEITRRREQVSRRQSEWENQPSRDLAELHYVLKPITSDDSRDEWFKVLGGIHHETRGSEEGRALAHEWSARDYDAYDANEVDAIWDAFDPDHKHPATMSTLVKLAQKYDPRFAPFGDKRFAPTINRNLR